MKLRATILFILFSICLNAQNVTLFLAKPQGLVNNAVFYTSPSEAAGYTAFGYPTVLGDGSVIIAAKKSDNHAGQGNFVIVRSTDGGQTSSLTTIKTSGGDIETSQGSFFRDAVNGYLYCLTIDATLSGNSPNFTKIETYRILESAFLANPSTATWTQTTTIDFTGYETGMVIADLWGSPIQLPSGKVMVPMSLRNTSTARTIGLFLETSNAGSTWSIGVEFADRVGSGGFPGSSINECNPVIVEVGASDATTKIVVLARAVSHGYWIHFKSSDGGSTWTEDVTNAFGYRYDNGGGTITTGAPANIPIDSKLHSDGYIYSVIGYRGTVGGNNINKLVALKMLAADFFANTSYPASAVTWDVVGEADVYNDVINEDEIHWGYPMLFFAPNGSLWAHYYDTHDPSSEWLGGLEKTRIMQVKIADQ
jgi:hypothetical protein